MFIYLQLAHSSHTHIAWRFHTNMNTFSPYERKVWQKQEMSLLLYYCNIKCITYTSHSSPSLSSAEIKYSDCTDSHIFDRLSRYNTIYCVISFQVSIIRQRGFVLELEVLDFNSEARRNLICLQYLFHFFHKSHYIVVLLQGNAVFHYSV